MTTIVTATGSLLQMGSHGPMGPQGGHGGVWSGAGGAGFGIVWSLGTLLVLVGVALGVFYLARELLDRRDERAGRDDALAALRERYARGEIDDEEFEQRSARLSADGTSYSGSGVK